jgi:hypothetical protein
VIRRALLLVLLAGAAAAEAPESSLRPVSRPGTTQDPAPDPARVAEVRAEVEMVAFSLAAVARSMRPPDRPAGVVARATEARAAAARGQVCGDPALQGEAIADISGPGNCGVDNPVRLRSVAGITLSQQAVVDCATASALKSWVERGAIPAVGSEGGGVDSLRVVAHYDCRNRNNAARGRLSEHATGRAIDIAGIGLRDGSEITVMTDWGGRANGRQLQQMHRAACGIFGTVLGPEANRQHHDHFHFDTARYRSGAYCK